MAHDAFNDRHFRVIPVSSIGEIVFDDVLITSADTLRRSVDGTETFVKWDGDEPASVASITGAGPVLDHEEMLELLATSDWSGIFASFSAIEKE